MSVENLVSSGPLILAIPVAAAAGALTFLSPCCLPLVPGYLSYITGMSGARRARPGGRRRRGGCGGHGRRHRRRRCRGGRQRRRHDRHGHGR